MRTPVHDLDAPGGVLTSTPPPSKYIRVLDFLRLVVWLDGRPILNHLEPYRQKILTDVLDTRDGDRMKFNLALLGRGKKNAKSLDLCLAALFALLANDSPHGNEVYIIASDEGQANDDLSLTKKLVVMSPHLSSRLVVREKSIHRKDGKGSIVILPGKDVAGQHGKSYRLAAFDEIHTMQKWDLLEAMQLDPTRPDAQMILTSYASIFHKPGVPLFDLLQQGKKGDDPRLYFSWYASDWCTDPKAMTLESPEARANPSLASFAPDYLEQQKRRLPAHVYRRLHLNLPGLPEGSAFTAEVIFDAMTRGVRVRQPERGIIYQAFVDMSGGSHDDACLGIAYRDDEGRAVLAHLINQGQACPFDPRKSVDRFAAVCKSYGIHTVVGDKYAGETFIHDFLRHNIQYEVCALPASQLYERIEPHLNAREIMFLDHGDLESQLLGLVWRSGKITHMPSEHDDYANAAVGACLLALDPVPPIDPEMSADELYQLQRLMANPSADMFNGIDPNDIAGNIFDRF